MSIQTVLTQYANPYHYLPKRISFTLLHTFDRARQSARPGIGIWDITLAG
jgi:hypothetical protein